MANYCICNNSNRRGIILDHDNEEDIYLYFDIIDWALPSVIILDFTHPVIDTRYTDYITKTKLDFN